MLQPLLEVLAVAGHLLSCPLAGEDREQSSDAVTLEVEVSLHMCSAAAVQRSEGDRQIGPYRPVDTAERPAPIRLKLGDLPREGPWAAGNATGLAHSRANTHNVRGLQLDPRNRVLPLRAQGWVGDVGKHGARARVDVDRSGSLRTRRPPEPERGFGLASPLAGRLPRARQLATPPRQPVEAVTMENIRSCRDPRGGGTADQRCHSHSAERCVTVIDFTVQGQAELGEQAHAASCECLVAFDSASRGSTDCRSTNRRPQACKTRLASPATIASAKVVVLRVLA